MNQPSVFISCVSPEFRQTRSRVAAILTRLGYTPVIQEIFGTEPGDLRQVLRDKIDACEGLIQIVGQGYGAEPPAADANYGRVSYTQFEFFYAREKKKKTWLLFAGHTCSRDIPLDRLDLPNDPTHPDPATYQAERRALQLTYRERRRNDGHLYYDAASDIDLELKIDRLRDELASRLRSLIPSVGVSPLGSRSEPNARIFDVFLSHPHTEAEAVEAIGSKLTDEAGLRVWFDRWILIPGQHWQQQMTKGLEQAQTCAVFVGGNTPSGWFREEIEKALNRQTKDSGFRVIPVILPNGDRKLIDDFLELRTWVEFKKGLEDADAFHLLVCGVRGIPPGRRIRAEAPQSDVLALLKAKLSRIRDLRFEKLIDEEIALEYQRRLLDELVKG